MTVGELRAHLNAARRDVVRAEQMRDRFAREALLAMGRADAFERLLAQYEQKGEDHQQEQPALPLPPGAVAITPNGAAPAA